MTPFSHWLTQVDSILNGKNDLQKESSLPLLAVIYHILEVTAAYYQYQNASVTIRECC